MGHGQINSSACLKCGHNFYNCRCSLESSQQIAKMNNENAHLRQQLAMAEDAANKGDKARHQAQALIDMNEDLKAKLADAETRLQGRTYCHSDQAVEGYVEKLEVRLAEVTAEKDYLYQDLSKALADEQDRLAEVTAEREEFLTAALQLADKAMEFYEKLSTIERDTAERCAEMVDTRYRILKETEAIHYRNSKDRFDPESFGFNLSLIGTLHGIAEAIRGKFVR